MLRTYCSLWDKHYAAKGLALHQSLVDQSSEPFRLYVLPVDTETHATLTTMALPNVVLLSLGAFELEMNLRPVRDNRSRLEYLWTLASQLVENILAKEPAVTYLDADLFFLSDPKVIFDEIGERSIGIVAHRLIPEKRHLEVNGIFNVGWVHVKNTLAGRRCALKWARQCREWCYNRVEPTRFGDQKYLDSWPEDYGPDCYVIGNIGANLAPWNLANYRVSMRDGELYVDDTLAVFFHAHEFKNDSDLTNYKLRVMDLLVYDRYIQAWRAAGARLEAVTA